MLATGVGTAMGLGWLEGYYLGGRMAPPVEKPTEAPPAAEEVPSEKVSEEIARMKNEIMDLNEALSIKSIGFTPGEYEVIKDLKVGKLLDEIPEDRDEAWRIFWWSSSGYRNRVTSSRNIWSRRI